MNQIKNEREQQVNNDRVTTTCLYCGLVFQVSGEDVNKIIFCRYDCKVKYNTNNEKKLKHIPINRNMLICNNCGISFAPLITKHTTILPKYCSKECNRRAQIERSKIYQKDNAEKTNNKNAIWKRKNKRKVFKTHINYMKKIKGHIFTHYGMKCINCGKEEKLCLSTKKEFILRYKNIKKTHKGNIYIWIYKNNMPPWFEVKCRSCLVREEMKVRYCENKEKPWNYGLTAKTSPKIKLIAEKLSDLHSSAGSIFLPKNKIREDLKEYGSIASSIEANFIRYLKYIGEPFEYQVPILLSNNSWYICDFYLPNKNKFIELKGYLREEARQKYELLKRDYPTMKWQLIMQLSEEWKKIVDFKNDIPLWEHTKFDKDIYSRLSRLNFIGIEKIEKNGVKNASTDTTTN
jgi:hypothetical protein